MNVALPPIVVFLILIPGFIVRSRYKRVERTSLDYAPFGEAVAGGVVVAFLLHALWLTSSYVVFRRSLDLGILLGLTSSDPSSQRAAMDAVRVQQWWVLSYFGSIIVVPFALAPGVRWLSEKNGWDAKDHWLSPAFRFNAPWYYLLSSNATADADADGIVIAAVVDVAGSAILYTGFLVEYFVGLDGTLDRLVLENVAPRPFERDKASDKVNEGRFYPIDGDYFVLRYSEAITLNVLYSKIEETTDGELAASETR